MISSSFDSLHFVHFLLQDLELALDGERRAAEDARQAAALLERKRIALQTELEDIRALLDAVSSLSSPVLFITLSLSISCRHACALSKQPVQGCNAQLDFFCGGIFHGGGMSQRNLGECLRTRDFVLGEFSVG